MMSRKQRRAIVTSFIQNEPEVMVAGKPVEIEPHTMEFKRAVPSFPSNALLQYTDATGLHTITDETHRMFKDHGPDGEVRIYTFVPYDDNGDTYTVKLKGR